jgi:endonuclease/exonuclease/phosphatase (EEP) superfamily protein YafD
MAWWDAALLFLGSLTVLLTVLPLWMTERWWVRVCEFPRFQIAVVATVVLAALATTGSAELWWNPPLGIALALAIAWQASWVWRYLPGARKQVRRSSRERGHPASLALFTANVLQDNRDMERLAAILAATDPDVILAVETDAGWCERLCAALAQTYPHQVMRAQSNTYGMALLSRPPLIAPELRCLVEDGVPSIRSGIALRSGDVIDLHCVHPRPPRPGEDTGNRDAELVLVAREVKARGRPAVVMGDLNDVAWSRTSLMLQRIGGLLDPRRGRGFFNTYPARWPGLRWPLDYIFHTAHFRLVSMQVLGRFGSDHLPLLAVLSYEPDGAGAQDEPRPGTEDWRLAQDRIGAQSSRML